MVSWSQHGDIVVGAAAKRQAVTNPKNTLFAIKRLLGRRYKSKEVDELRRIMPYEIIEASNGDAWVRVQDKELSAQEISARVLEQMKRVAEQDLGEEVTDPIVTVPASFAHVHRHASH